jgi:hypothetical protein
MADDFMPGQIRIDFSGRWYHVIDLKERDPSL